jgi:hypothetical protein
MGTEPTIISRTVNPRIAKLQTEPTPCPRETLPHLGPGGELLKTHWEAVVDVFTRDSFGRIWIVQEIELGKEVEVICGAHTLPWPSFFAAAMCIMNLGLVADKSP